MNEIRNTKYERRGFTLIELVVAIGVMAMVVVFAGVVFKTSIASYRVATAQAEIMQKFRAITDLLNNDFQGLRKDGYLILYSTTVNRLEYASATSTDNFRSDRLYFFSTGDFQSWYNSGVRSNIARIYLGHDWTSLDVSQNIPVNRWRLAQDVNLLTFGMSGGDYNDVNFAWCQVHPADINSNANAMFLNPPDINMTYNSNSLRRLLCENAGQLQIEWTDGTINAGNGAIVWFGLNNPKGIGFDYAAGPYYEAIWQPTTSADLWPKAIKFTFTLYDSHYDSQSVFRSQGLFKNGQTFTHIVYLGD
jgi:prepilin-type N-terminal cleavage/methylation domain-containing protein